jgi:hypothetical protein
MKKIDRLRESRDRAMAKYPWGHPVVLDAIDKVLIQEHRENQKDPLYIMLSQGGPAGDPGME